MSTPYGGFRPGRIQQTFSAFVMGASIVVSGCATTSGDKAAAANPVDPYENINRKVFTFNDKVDNYVAEPVSNAYKWVTPQFVQTGVFNFFNNLKNINVVINDMLQAKFQQSAQDGGRFLMNTTVGVGGLFDVAKHVGWEQNEEDFEQTLAVWGVPQGSYLVIPFLGPSTARGIPGTAFDTAANPATYVGLPIQLVSMLNTRASAEGALKFIDEAALDPYVFTRESFLQWRNNLATDGKMGASAELTEFEDELDTGANAASGQAKAAGDNAGKPDAASASEKDVQAQPVSESKKIPQISASAPGSASQPFEDATKSFEEADAKLDKLIAANKARKHRKKR